MRAGGWHASVTVINYSRVSGRPAGDPVRQWDLQVGFDSDLDPVPPSEDDEAE